METATREPAKGFSDLIRGKSTFTVPHLEGKLTLTHPFEGPGDYATLGSNLTAQGLYKPTMAETASLVYVAWQNPKGELESETISKLRSSYFYAFNRLLWLKDEVLIANDNQKAPLDASDLSKLEKLLRARLKHGDTSVRRVPYGFQTGSQSALDLERNKFMIKLAGKEGAEKLAYASSKYNSKPLVYAPDKSDFPTARVAGLDSDWVLVDYRLGVYGGRFVDSGNGFASGVQKSSVRGAHGAKNK